MPLSHSPLPASSCVFEMKSSPQGHPRDIGTTNVTIVSLSLLGQNIFSCVNFFFILFLPSLKHAKTLIDMWSSNYTSKQKQKIVIDKAWMKWGKCKWLGFRISGYYEAIILKKGKLTIWDHLDALWRHGTLWYVRQRKTNGMLSLIRGISKSLTPRNGEQVVGGWAIGEMVRSWSKVTNEHS